MSWIWSQSAHWSWGNTWPLDRIFGRVQFERGPTVWPLMIDYNHSHFHLSHLSGDVGGFFNLLKGVGFCRLSPELTDWSTDRAVSVRRSSKQFARRWPPPHSGRSKPPAPSPLLCPTQSISSCRPVIRGHGGLVPPPPSCWIDHCGPIILQVLSLHLRFSTTPPPHTRLPPFSFSSFSPWKLS